MPYHEAIKTARKKLKIYSEVILGGGTGFLQAPDVSWKKPFKDVYTKCNDE